MSPHPPLRLSTLRLRPSYAFASLLRQTRHLSSAADPTINAVHHHEHEHPWFRFMEEPLGIPARESCGYFQGGPGLSLGPEKRFKLQAKFGWGAVSSVWLARDCVNNTHVAVKILSGFTTKLNQDQMFRELEIVQRLSESMPPNSPFDRCPRLVDHFVHPGIEESDGEHICIVTELFWSNFSASQALLNKGRTPILIVKRVLKDVLLGLAHLHRLGIVHIDIKPDNVTIHLGTQWTTAAIDKWVAANPPTTYPPERSLTKMVCVFRSQPFPPPSLEELYSYRFKLADFSSSQFVADQTIDNVVPFGLKTPELILGTEWDESVDIWTIGCVAFYWLTNRPSFEFKASQREYESNIDTTLYEMSIVCGEVLRARFLQCCHLSHKYFDSDCTLKKFKNYTKKPLDECLLSTGCVLAPSDLTGATDFLTQCFRLDPKDCAAS